MGSCTSCTGVDNPFPVPFTRDAEFKDNWGWVVLECVPIIGAFFALKSIWNIMETKKGIAAEMDADWEMLRHYKALRVQGFLMLVAGVALLALGLTTPGNIPMNAMAVKELVYRGVIGFIGGVMFVGSWYAVHLMRQSVRGHRGQLEEMLGRPF